MGMYLQREGAMEIQNISGPDVITRGFNPEGAPVQQTEKPPSETEREPRAPERGRGEQVDTYV